MARRNRRNDGNASAVGNMLALRSEFGAGMSSFCGGNGSGRFAVGGGGNSIGGSYAQGAADQRLRPDEYYGTIEDSRIAHDRFPIVGGLTRQARIHRVQEGFAFKSQTPVEEANRWLDDWCEQWLDDPERFDVSGELNWAELQKAVEEAVIRDGDALLLGTDDGRLQMVEGHRVRSSSWAKGADARKDGVTEHLGVVCDSRLRRVGYRITRVEPRGPFAPVRMDDLVLVDTRDADGVRQVFHCHDAMRASQTRGVSAWANMLETTNMLDQGKFSLLVKTVLAASLAWALKEKPGAPQTDYGQRDEDLSQQLRAHVEQIHPGGVVHLQEGEELALLGQNIGASEAIKLIEEQTRELSLALGLPLFVGVLDAEKTGNFSSARMTWDLAKIGIKNFRQTRAKQLAYPMREWRLRMLLREASPDGDKARAFYDACAKTPSGPASFFWCHAQAPGWPYPQPYDDANANALAVSTFQNSLRRVARENGDDFAVLAEENAGDKFTILEQMAQQYDRAMKLYRPVVGADFTFKDFLELGMTKGQPLPRAPQPAADPSKAKEAAPQ